ncbi:NAD(P)H-dependent flavin oxidoreductase [Noviherbaspirillum sp. Root189]|uniref:NAD(P)H-dependent flavin oxidoreductase n=1 Tax=Noviherbaspirillum sp. Root189 TaxID=1736487 RepID=UPI00070FBFA6|nr:nitronate monooxygenase [Noviherbaspirillum sp. Root189]KRB81558.1 2-nitropropane dioxygenase [Noviherbaspirillum sp. Root189]
MDRIETRATHALNIRYPIVQGGLARIAKAELAAAVSNAGGMGQIAVAGLSDPDVLRAEIRKAKRLTQAPFGVNFPIGHLKIDALLDLTIEEGVTAVSFTGGNPQPYIRRLEGTDTRVMVLVSGPEQAQKAEQAGAHVVATVGYEGGGHIGRSDLTTIVAIPLVVRAVGIPVLAGGGIADGAGLAAALALGADGVEIGTRFIAVKEAFAHDNYKDAVVRANASDTVVVKRSLGTPGRALANAWTERILSAEAEGQSREAIFEMVKADANERGVFGGDMESSLVWVGQAAAMVDDVPSAGEYVERMVAEAKAAGKRLARLLG